MSWAYIKLYPEAEGTLEFIDRGDTNYTEEFLQQLKIEISNLGMASLTDSERDAAFEKTGQWIPMIYWEWLQSFRFDPNKIDISLVDKTDKNGNPIKALKIRVTDKLYKAVLYEVHLLAIVSELRHKMLGNVLILEQYIGNLVKKIEMSNQHQLKFGDMGTRRRYNLMLHDEVIRTLKNKAMYFTGTSNVMLAIKYDLPVIGTMAHSWIQFHAAQYGYRNANYQMMEAWMQVYDGNLGCALTDTLTNSVFFDNFSRKHALLFRQIRHDSGDPYLYVMKAIARYRELGIDPTSKTIVFSNALDFQTYKDIADYCKGRIGCVAGIGTNLTCDVVPFGFKPANIVMKMTECKMNSRKNSVKTIKISDDIGKAMGDKKELALASDTLNLNLKID
jgi:nicotinate phosphoribosyltransferase